MLADKVPNLVQSLLFTIFKWLFNFVIVRTVSSCHVSEPQIRRLNLFDWSEFQPIMSTQSLIMSMDDPSITETTGFLPSPPLKPRSSAQKLTLLLLLSVTIVTFGSFQYGYNLSATNTPQESIGNRGNPEACESRSFYKPCIPMTSEQYTLFASIFLVGAFSSSLFAGFTSESLGRKATLMIANLFIVVGSMLLTILSNFYFLLLGRFLIGIGVGFASVVVPAYLSEISPNAYRGCIGFMHQLVLVMAIATANLVAIPFSYRPGWRVIMALPGCVAIVQMCFLPFLYETPRWLVTKGWKNLGKESLSRYRGTEDVEEEFSVLAKPKEESHFSKRSSQSFGRLF
jgi:MFS family permease